MFVMGTSIWPMFICLLWVSIWPMFLRFTIWIGKCSDSVILFLFIIYSIHYYRSCVFIYSVRWYSEETSKYWIGDFKPSTEVGVDMVIWLIVLPFASFVLHSVSLHINLFRKQTCQSKNRSMVQQFNSTKGIRSILYSLMCSHQNMYIFGLLFLLYSNIKIQQSMMVSLQGRLVLSLNS